MEKGHRTTAYLLPLIAMQEQFILRSRKLGLKARIWDSTMDSQDAPDILLVVMETSSSDGFRLHLEQLVQANRLARVIIDEAHLILAHCHFRPVMNTLTWVGALGVPAIVQSATIPPSILPHLFAKVGVTHYTICREPTPRPNVAFKVQTVDDVDSHIARIWAARNVAPLTTLFFCSSEDVVKRLAKSLRIEPCYAALGNDANSALLSRLRNGSIRGIITTPVLGVALDVPDVSLVVHRGCPFNMLGYIQESGRSGRNPDGFATSLVLLERNFSPHKVQEPDYAGTRLMDDHIRNDTHCRHWMITLFNDGVGMTCTMMPWISNLCDVCERQVDSLVPVEYSSDMILPYLLGQ